VLRSTGWESKRLNFELALARVTKNATAEINRRNLASLHGLGRNRT
jgi:hypothetical protein